MKAIIYTSNTGSTAEYAHGRLYTKEEMWDNFKYFLDRVLPVCEDIDLKLALHPNDPPVPTCMAVMAA